MSVDLQESMIYIACDNLNVYQTSLRDTNQKKTMTHKKRITAMTLTTDGQKLICGDAAGLIYTWNLESDDFHLKTFELHRDKGAITNLVAIERPLSLFGLTASMTAYDPCQTKSL